MCGGGGSGGGDSGGPSHQPAERAVVSHNGEAGMGRRGEHAVGVGAALLEAHADERARHHVRHQERTLPLSHVIVRSLEWIFVLTVAAAGGGAAAGL